MEIRGGFSTYNLTVAEKDTFAEYLQHSMNNPAIEFLKYLLGDDYLKFIDIMSGTTIKIPSQKTLLRDLESVKIFLYVKRNNFEEDTLKEAARIYGKTALTARRYVLKVAKVLGIEEQLEGDSLNNYIKNIKSIEDLDSYYQTRAEAKRNEIDDRRKKRLEKEKQQYEEYLKSTQNKEENNE